MSEVRLIDANALLKRVDEEREYLKARGQLGAEHILVHNFRDLIDNAPTINKCDNCDLMFKEKTKSIPNDVSEVTDYSVYPTVSEVKND